MTVQFRLGQYARHDFRVWSSPAGVIITDTKMIDALEKEYRCQQAHHNGHQSNDRGTVRRVIQAVKRTPQQKAREWRGPEKA